MTDSVFKPKNRKVWLIGLTVVILIAAVAVYRYSKSQAQQDVLTIGISPPYAELLQSVADDVKNKEFRSNWSNSLTGMHQMLQYKTAILMPTFSSKASFYAMQFVKLNMTYMPLPQVQVVMSDYILKNISLYRNSQTKPAWSFRMIL